MGTLLIIRGPNITGSVVSAVASLMKPGDLGGVLVHENGEYYWDVYEDAMVKEAV